MKDTKREKELRVQIEDLRSRLEEAMDTLRAIRSGEVDALVVSTPQGDQIYTLKGAERVYRLILETLNEGVLTMTPDGSIMYTNSRFSEVLQIPLEKIIGSSIYGFISPTDRTAFEAILEQGRKEKSRGEISFTKGDGALLPVQLSVNPVEIEGVSALCFVAVDLTESKRIQKQLRDLSSQLLTAHEDERKRVAREIHDSIGSQLSAIRFKMETFFKQMPELSESIFAIIHEAIDESRRIQMDLHPSTLDDLGIGPTLSWFCRNFERVYSHIRIEQVVGIEESEVPKPLKAVIYRITQEALNNIAKHSQADCVCLSLQKNHRAIELTIQDNGQGFDLTETLSDDPRKGLGLISMKERAGLS
ncbi:MAG: PAS domain S-box protein, partial [Deltaproteobacteria bacterium]